MKLARQILIASAITLAGAYFAHRADAAEHIVEMLNKGEPGETMVLKPAFLKVQPGDTVKFVPTDKNHNVESVKEIWPEGVEPVKGSMNKEVSFTAEKEGLYLFKCLPHYAMGMVALIQVGKPVNLDKLEAFKAAGNAQPRLSKALQQVEK